MFARTFCAFVAIYAIALTAPADSAPRKAKARHQPTIFCQSYDEPGVNPHALTCARRVR